LDKLNFLTAGMPLRTNPKDGYESAFQILKEMDLDGLELEFVRGVRMSEKSRQTVKKYSENFTITAHAPFYINLNSKEEDKVEASILRIIETANTASSVSAYSITYHAAYYMGEEKDIVFKKVVDTTKKIMKVLDEEKIDIWIRPETTGKATQWGDIDEIIALSKEFDKVLPCVDFSHIHARSAGGFNSYDDFCMILEKIEKNLGRFAIENFHGHLAGIAYSDKGEKNHLNLEESDMNYKDLLRAIKSFDVKGALVCESPNIEDDCRLMKEFYKSL